MSAEHTLFEDPHHTSGIEPIRIFPWVEISYIGFRASQNVIHRHTARDELLEINYCRVGPLGWRMQNGNEVFLGTGDFSLHTRLSCAESVITLPNGYYEGLSVCIDLNELSREPIPLLSGTGINGEYLYRKFCENGALSSFAGNEQSNSIFDGFYGQPEHLTDAYRKIKVIELLLYLSKLEKRNLLTEYQSEQVEIIHRIHDELLAHVEERMTIEELAKKYLISTTTLKTVFRSVYGNSLAAHMKEHRMERAAELLRTTDKSIQEIAICVGYDSQSRFSSAFREVFHVLPTEYRRG